MEAEENTPGNSFWIIKIYPFGVLLLSIGLNFSFGIEPLQASIPSTELLGLLSFSAILLVINHSWIMTATELTRNRFKIFASPEEQVSNDISESGITEKGRSEIERHLNTHRNTTENIVYYIFLALIFILVSPSQLAAWVWILAFPLARLGYTYSYFMGNDSVRGIFMSLTLLSVYGISGYLAFGFLFKQLV